MADRSSWAFPRRSWDSPYHEDRVRKDDPDPPTIGASLQLITGYLDFVAGRKERTSEDYRAEYLRSPHWRARRRIALEKAEWTCQHCGVHSRFLDVHHLTYDRIGQELDSDLEVICRACHKEEHGH